MKEFESQTYSQNGEDGIIEYIFEKIGTTNKIAVEFGVSVGAVSGQTNTRIDLLSVDVDGNDYHLREALKEYSPRVCVMEYNGAYDGTTKYIMPEDDSYVWKNKETIFGASLSSLTDQANRLGYDLVHCEKRGVNAFFVRKDINPFPARTSEQAWVPLFWAWRKKK